MVFIILYFKNYKQLEYINIDKDKNNILYIFIFNLHKRKYYYEY